MRKKKNKGVVHITNLFEKYKKNLVAPQKTVIDAFQKATQEVVGIELKTHHLSYSPHTKTLSLSVSGTIKTEIFLRKKEVLTHIEKNLGKKNTPTTIL